MANICKKTTQQKGKLECPKLRKPPYLIGKCNSTKAKYSSSAVIYDIFWDAKKN